MPTILMPVLVSLSPSHLLGVGKALGGSADPCAGRCTGKISGSANASRIARANNNELFLLILLDTCLGSAALAEAVGLFLALGAFAAGLMVSASPFAHRALDQMCPYAKPSWLCFS